jgi:CRP-like cAMP-binding protein
MSQEALAALGDLEMVDLVLRAELEHPNEPLTYAYFPESGLASVVAAVEGAGSIEVGMIGVEGLVGFSLIEADDRTPFSTFIQGEGRAYRLPAAALVEAAASNVEVRTVLLRYARAFTVQVASTAFANGNAHLEARLSRWLLMVGDRLGTSFPITHEFLGLMLSVRRSGVTLALQILEGKGLINAKRGRVAIVDRAGLVDNARGSYGMAEREYERLLGSEN